MSDDLTDRKKKPGFFQRLFQTKEEEDSSSEEEQPVFWPAPTRPEDRPKAQRYVPRLAGMTKDLAEYRILSFDHIMLASTFSGLTPAQKADALTVGQLALQVADLVLNQQLGQLPIAVPRDYMCGRSLPEETALEHLAEDPQDLYYSKAELAKPRLFDIIRFRPNALELKPLAVGNVHVQEHNRRGGEASKWYVVEPGEVLGYDLNNGLLGTDQTRTLFEPALRICDECSREYPSQQFIQRTSDEPDDQPLTLENVRQQLQAWNNQPAWRNMPLCVPTNYYVSSETAQLTPDYNSLYGLYRFIHKTGSKIFRQTRVRRVLLHDPLPEDQQARLYGRELYSWEEVTTAAGEQQQQQQQQTMNVIVMSTNCNTM